MLSALENRLADPAFDEFRRRRLASLIADAMPVDTALKFAVLETRERARASLTVGIQRALAARFEINLLGLMLDDDPDELQFRLVIPA